MATTSKTSNTFVIVKQGGGVCVRDSSDRNGERDGGFY